MLNYLFNSFIVDQTECGNPKTDIHKQKKGNPNGFPFNIKCMFLITDRQLAPFRQLMPEISSLSLYLFEYLPQYFESVVAIVQNSE